jgi:hypothetical protein
VEPAILFLLVIPLIGVGIYYAWKAEQQRREKLHAFAMSKGWSFQHDDPYGLADRWSEAPFGKGHSRRASNLVEGIEAGRAFLSFDYLYKETTSNGKTTQTTTYRFHVTALALPAALPDLYVGRENVMTRLGGALGLDDIELESEDFNRRFRVQASSPKFAHDVLHPRTMHGLITADCPAFRIDGANVLMWCKGKASPQSLLGHLAALRGFVDGIPQFVWKDHGYDPGSATHPGGVTQ